MPNQPVLTSFTPINAHGQLTSLNTDKTMIVAPDANGILIQATAQNVRVRLDGVAATSGVGFQIKAGDSPTLFLLHAGSVIHVIEETASAKVDFQSVRV